MTFGREPQNPNPGQPYGQQGQQPQYGQPYGQNAPQYTNPNQTPYQQGAAGAQYAYSAQANAANAPAVNAQVAYSFEQASRVSSARAYGEMTIGVLITAVVAWLSTATNALMYFLSATGGWGWIGLAIVQIGLAMVLAARVMKMQPAAARAMFYIYAALMGFTLSSIFYVYNLGSIALTLGLTVGFFFVLTMLALTTKVNMLKAGPILMVALLVLIVGEVVLMFIAPSNTMMMLISAIGLVIFAGLTAYDAQKTRALFAEYATDTITIKRLSIVCALNLYLDFVNMFLFLLRLVGGRN